MLIPRRKGKMNRSRFVLILLVSTAFARALFAQTSTTQPADQIDTILESKIDIKLTGLTAEQAMSQLQELTRLNLLVDWDGLKNVGLARIQPLDGELKGVPAKEVIRIILSEGGCTQVPPIVRDGHLLRLAPPPWVETRVFPVEKILNRLTKQSPAATQPVPIASASDQLIATIQHTISPDLWRDLGGNAGSIRMFGKRLIVTQTPETIAKIGKLLSDLEKDDAK